jgi:hypothetical protein
VAVSAQDGVGELGVGHHGRVEAGDIVRAQDADLAAGERHIDQRLVLDAGGVFLPGPAGPDRLADEPYAGGGGVGVGEGRQHPRDDTTGVAARFPHVEHVHPGRVPPKGSAQQIEVGAGDGDGHRIARRQPVTHERQRAVQVFAIP